jgi:hypothetical protein
MGVLRRMTTVAAAVKAPKLTYLIRNPIRGCRNLLALRGAKSLLKTRGAALTAAAATTALAVPFAVRKLAGKSK